MSDVPFLPLLFCHQDTMLFLDGVSVPGQLDGDFGERPLRRGIESAQACPNGYAMCPPGLQPGIAGAGTTAV
jgi:hypothetical protein